MNDQVKQYNDIDQIRNKISELNRIFKLKYCSNASSPLLHHPSSVDQNNNFPRHQKFSKFTMGNTNSSHPPMSRRSSTEEDFQALQKQEMIDLIVLLKQKLQDLLFLKEQKADSNFLTSNESSVTDYLPVNVRESLHGSVSDLHQPHPNLKNSKKSKNNTLNFNEPLDFEIEHQQNLKSGKNSKTSLNSELNLANSTTSLTNILSNEAIRNRDLKLALQETYSLRSYSSTSNKFSWISQSHNSSGRSTPMNENLKQGHMLESNHSIFKGYCEVCLLPCFFKARNLFC